jgi:hypothetical protein
MIVNVFNSSGTAPIAIQAILDAGTYDPGPKGSRIEDPAQWTPGKIAEKAAKMSGEKGPSGDFDD